MEQSVCMDGRTDTLMPLPHRGRPPNPALPSTAVKLPTCGTLGAEYIYMPNGSEERVD